ncbi:pancreas transcription factor 1 subunit alpha-like [Oculina patagonica]
MVNSTMGGGIRVMSACVPVCKLETPAVPSSMVQRRKKHRRRGPRLTGVSKQRKSANARERTRVQVINSAYETLRELIPLLPTEKRPSKIETVRLAALYIHHLTELLTNIGKREPTIKGKPEPFNVVIKKENIDDEYFWNNPH